MRKPSNWKELSTRELSSLIYELGRYNETSVKEYSAKERFFNSQIKPLIDRRAQLLLEGAKSAARTKAMMERINEGAKKIKEHRKGMGLWA